VLNPSTDQLPVQILSVGTFGRSVATYLKGMRHDVFETVADNDVLPLPATWLAARQTLLASWKPAPALCELLDDVCHTWARPFLPLILDSRYMRFGPIIIPGKEGCWKCWNRRFRRQLTFPEDYAELLNHYDCEPGSGPRGFLEPFAMMGAARFSHAIDTIDSGSDLAGTIWQLDMLTGTISTGKLIGIHGCKRCGEGRNEESRSYADMQKSLEYLWTESK
jgi:bacteriocin biosynthesis cyclodehydratase domain-containing protein